MYQAASSQDGLNRSKRSRTAAMYRASWRGGRAGGAPGSGEQRQRQQVGSSRHLGSRARGAGCPFLITGRAQSGEVGRGGQAGRRAWDRVRPDDTLDRRQRAC